MKSLVQLPPMSVQEIRALIANCEFGEIAFEAMGVPGRPTHRDMAKAKLEAALLQARAAEAAMVN